MRTFEMCEKINTPLFIELDGKDNPTDNLVEKVDEEPVYLILFFYFFRK